MNRHRLSWVITEQDDGTLIRDYLSQIAGLSKRLIIKAKQQEGAILINDEHRTVRYVLKHGDVLEVIFPPEEISPYLQPELLPLDIVYEDADVLVVNKESGMPTMPSCIHTSGTLANAILYYYQEQRLPYTVHVVTRLDKDTSGLVLIAKHQYSHSFLSMMQRKNEIERIYTAVVHGEMEDRQGLIDQPIGRHPSSIIERIVTSDGQEARTFFHVQKMRDNLSFVKVRLKTGRTHQIRVHFASIGHPLLGDDLYGGTREKMNRQALHCSELTFQHPFSKKELALTAQLPADMELLNET